MGKQMSKWLLLPLLVAACCGEKPERVDPPPNPAPRPPIIIMVEKAAWSYTVQVEKKLVITRPKSDVRPTRTIEEVLGE